MRKPLGSAFHSVLLLLCGALLTLAYSPFHWHWLPFVILPLVVKLIWPLAPRRAFRAGFVFGLGWFGAGLSWIYVSIDQYGGVSLPITLLLLVLLFAYLALFPAIAFWCWQKLSHRKFAWRFSLPFFWLIAELLRGWLFTGFPWLSLGYSQTDGIFGGLASVIGETGITVALWFTAIAVVVALRNKKPALLIIPLVLLTCAAIFPKIQSTERNTESMSVLLVQGNIQQSLKWQAEQQWPNILRYLDLTRPQFDHDLVIWPESAITALEPYASDVLNTVEKSASINNSALITGIIDYDRLNDDFYNSVIVLDNQGYNYGNANRYQKHQLLPIGEFVPFEDLLRPLAPLFNLPMSSFSRGSYQQPNLKANGSNLAMAICYEIAFSGQVRSNTYDDTDYLVTLSNDTWFGDSHGPWQHMQIARMRAMEMGKPLLRATNNGVTAAVDEFGRYIALAPQFKATALSANVYPVRGSTIFNQIGNWGAIILALFGLLPIFATKRAKKNPKT
ncbi:apolipoprotein N-acyltransferase [Idiomarina aminovorans]|uniref:apolipoprotein N-acyltransferase n=1 Tax=Idiomarina aminovorans TaxID=2914829 RepID=UPI002003F0B2|nr:apolipoprotein N-acyltransferase [Idiomarina sp. ATCH4]MCK7458238.1 apolipoprotein N-acyltransferase [Idiomarina sp. ATCH4]